MATLQMLDEFETSIEHKGCECRTHLMFYCYLCSIINTPNHLDTLYCSKHVGLPLKHNSYIHDKDDGSYHFVEKYSQITFIKSLC